MRHENKSVPFTILLILFVSGYVVAQSPLGSISGVVRDQSGGVLPGVLVTVTNEGTGQLVQTTTTNSEGGFVIPQISAGSYAIKLELTGFNTAVYSQVKVDPGREYSLAATLTIGAINIAVTVTAGVELINTTSSEISNTVVRRQIIDLPLNGRNPIELIRLQAGVVGVPTRTNTTINGGRPTWTQITQDGINIQDNYIRLNALDFVPNRPTSDTIGEFTITTNTQGADSAGGASQVKLITPSGSNKFHGSLYEFNRNSALAANTWFNNASGVSKPHLNRNQFGGNISGPVWLPKSILKDKLFFFFSYEGLRQRTQTTQNNTIPVNDQFLQGVFRYIRPSDGTIQSANVMDPGSGGVPALAIDQQVKALVLDVTPPASKVNNYDVGNSNVTRQLNTAGYRFLQSDFNDRNQYALRFDYQASRAHRFEFVYQHMRETDDRPDYDTITTPRPLIYTDSPVNLLVGAWRWTLTSSLLNELRIGANLAPGKFESKVDYSGIIFNNLPFITQREVTFLPQGRDTRTYQYADNASWIKGEHSIQFGVGLQQIFTNPYDYRGVYPLVDFGFSTAAPANQQLTAANFPGGISATDLTNANSLRTFLGGIISQVTQSFQVKDKTSGYIAGYPFNRDYTLNDWSLYIQDSWRLRSNLTVRAGLKWEYFSPLKEDNDLALLPVVDGRPVEDVLLDPNGTVDFTDGGFYGKDLNNFGPSVGFAWDPFKNGNMSIRFGYTLAFVNEDAIMVGWNASSGNAGLNSTAALRGQYTTVAAGVPVVPAQPFKVPRSYADQIALSATNYVFGIDPDLRQPSVHQLSFIIERRIGEENAIEARYVATMGRGIWRGVDYNQTNAAVNQAYYDDFLRARSNGFLSLAATGVFNPAYNASISGSQPLTVIPTFGGGFLTNSTVRSYIQTGQLASLADLYVSNRISGAPEAFLPNPGIYAADLVINGGQTDYHAFQTEFRRRLSNGVFGHLNYTFSKVLSNSAGTAAARFEPFIDNDRPQLEKTRAEFDMTHVINGSAIYELPLGPGKRFLPEGGVLGRIVGGWQVSSILHWQSGAPFSILSARGTFNRGGRSSGNPVDSTLTRDQIKSLFGIRKLGDGRVFYIDPAVIDPNTGRAVGTDNLNNTAGFAGQAFFNPVAGTIGQMQRLQFDGPSQISWDFSFNKRTRIRENSNLEIRADFFNFINHPMFYVGDTNVNSSQFGRITSLISATGPRVVQVAARLNF